MGESVDLNVGDTGDTTTGGSESEQALHTVPAKRSSTNGGRLRSGRLAQHARLDNVSQPFDGPDRASPHTRNFVVAVLQGPSHNAFCLLRLSGEIAA